MDITEVMDLTKEEQSVWQDEREPLSEPIENLSIETRSAESQPEHLLHDEYINELRSRWETIQIDFVDEPYQSVREADELVKEVLGMLSRLYTERRTVLEHSPGDDQVSTEDLRLALRDYRSLFNRLLEI